MTTKAELFDLMAMTGALWKRLAKLIVWVFFWMGVTLIAAVIGAAAGWPGSRDYFQTLDSMIIGVLLARYVLFYNRIGPRPWPRR